MIDARVKREAQGAVQALVLFLGPRLPAWGKSVIRISPISLLSLTIFLKNKVAENKETKVQHSDEQPLRRENSSSQPSSYS